MNQEKKRIGALIVDDEPLARHTIRDLLADEAEIEVLGECKSGPEAVNAIRRQSPDLLFLDIQMPGMNGFEVLARVEHERIPAIIFVTAFDEYALKAFEVHSLDYLLKPFNDKRFKEAVNQAKTRVELGEISKLSQNLLAVLGDKVNAESSGGVRKRYLSRFMIRAGGKVTFIQVGDVDWIGADDYYIKLHVGPKSHLLRLSMNELEQKLDPRKFLRIHRSTIINSDRLKELHQNPNGEYIVILKSGVELKLSRNRRERLEQLLTNDYD